ncbi:hypothetical protein GCM10028806_25510 [Spirosoma terrae]|uniref:DUF5615 domain-containing protein n=1 Tax=Spirosoma terrae TaxID=1968276 RepID=A0A6L9LK46_9BACT|nr:DUF5615 family PIN-like protein [Spirosoma terrae]NDU97019.1 hypothetical protein [Spirosoma terrae]
MEHLRFIVDTQLPPVLASFLRRKGFDAIHTTHFDNGHLLADNAIRTIAIAEERIVITKDSDFPDLFYKLGPPPRLLYLTLGNIRNNDLVDWLDQQLPSIISLFNDSASMVVATRTHLISY